MSSGCLSWYLFNGFALVENSVVDFFFPAKMSVDLPWEEVILVECMYYYGVCIEHDVRTYLSRSKLAKIARTLSP